MMVEQRLAVLEKQFDVHGNVGYTILPADLAWLLSLVRSVLAVVEALEEDLRDEDEPTRISPKTSTALQSYRESEK